MEYFTTDHLIIVLFFAVLAAIIYTFFMQRSLSDLASRLLDKKADSEENALTLTELGYKGAVSALLAGFFAENGNSISAAIVKVKKEAENADTELLFEKKEAVRYYIPEDKNDERLQKHIKDKLSFSKLVIIIVLLAAIAFAAGKVIDLLTDYAGTLSDGTEKVYGVEKDETTLLEEQAEANRKEEEQKKEEEALEQIKQEANAELEAAEKAEQSEAQQQEALDEEASESEAASADAKEIAE